MKKKVVLNIKPMLHLSDKIHIVKSILNKAIFKSAEYLIKPFKYFKQHKSGLAKKFAALKCIFTYDNLIHIKNEFFKNIKAILKFCEKQAIIKKQFKLNTYSSCLIVFTLAFTLWASYGFKAFGMEISDNNSQSSNKTSSIKENNDTEALNFTLSQHILQVKEQNTAEAQQAASAANTKTITMPVVAAANVITPAVSTKIVAANAGDYSNDPFRYPQCVWYVWARVKAVNGISLQFKDSSGRNAKNWFNLIVQTNGVQVVRDKTAIEPDCIAVFSRGGEGNGHVLFVENVVRTSSGKPISVTFSESNWGASKKPSTKTLSWGAFLSRSYGSLIGYIYL